MDFLARKISRAKWEGKDFLDDAEPSADAITGCLKTSDNALSVWLCPSVNREDAKRAVLALASSSKYSRLEKMHVVVLPKSNLASMGFKLVSSPKSADTHVQELVDAHMDISSLGGTQLLKLAQFIVVRVRENTGCHMFSKAEVRQILEDAIATGKLRREQLPQEVQQALN